MMTLLYFIWLINLPWATSEVFSSVSHMEVLLDTQQKTVKNLNSYVDKETARIDLIERHLNRFKTEHEIAMKDVPFYLGNPLNAYTLIKRLTTDLTYVENKIRETTVFKKDVKLTYPSMDDFVGAIQGLVRLHATYKLNLSQIVSGELVTNYTLDGKVRRDVFTPLSASDCFEIGSGFYNEKAWKTGVQWMLKALDKFYEERDESFGLNEYDIVHYICFGYYTIDDVVNSIKWTRRLIGLKPNDSATPRYAALLNKYTRRLAQEQKDVSEGKEPVKFVKDDMLLETNKNHLVFNSYCRNEGPGVPANITKRLHCCYVTGPHSFLRLARIKAERLYTQPPIYLFYDVLGDDEIQHLIDIANPKISHASTLTNNDTKPTEDKKRVAKSAFHQDHESIVIETISRRVEHFTRLSADSAEPLQVANYGFAGNFIPHNDFCQHGCNKWQNGNRVATVIFYMTKVAQGGATVFDKIGVTVYPIKGAALYFLNIDTAGKPYQKAHHGACPVIQGSKWVAVKWLTEKGQVFTRPCNPRRHLKNRLDFLLANLPHFKTKNFELKFNLIE